MATDDVETVTMMFVLWRRMYGRFKHYGVGGKPESWTCSVSECWSKLRPLRQSSQGTSIKRWDSTFCLSRAPPKSNIWIRLRLCSCSQINWRLLSSEQNPNTAMACSLPRPQSNSVSKDVFLSFSQGFQMQQNWHYPLSGYVIRSVINRLHDLIHSHQTKICSIRSIGSIPRWNILPWRCTMRLTRWIQ